MKQFKLIFFSGFTALIVGLLTGYFHFGPVESFLSWGIVAFVVGYFLQNKKEVWVSGVVFGLVLSFAFMLSAFGGTSDKLPGYLILTLGISIAGIIGSIVTIFFGNFLKRKVSKNIKGY